MISCAWRPQRCRRILFAVFIKGEQIQLLALYNPSSRWPSAFKGVSLIMQYALSPLFITLLSVSLWPTALALRAWGILDQGCGAFCFEDGGVWVGLPMVLLGLLGSATVTYMGVRLACVDNYFDRIRGFMWWNDRRVTVLDRELLYRHPASANDPKYSVAKIVTKVFLTLLGVVFNTLPDNSEPRRQAYHHVSGFDLVGAFLRIPFALVLVYYSWCCDPFFPGVPGRDYNAIVAGVHVGMFVHYACAFLAFCVVYLTGSYDCVSGTLGWVLSLASLPAAWISYKLRCARARKDLRQTSQAVALEHRSAPQDSVPLLAV